MLISVELQQMFDNDSKTLLDYDPQELDQVPFKATGSGAPSLSTPKGSGSGGFVENVFIHASQELFGITPETLVYVPGRYGAINAVLLCKNTVEKIALSLSQKNLVYNSMKWLP
jgi:hypothetical protein